MNILAEKLGLIEWITKLNDVVIIDRLKMIRDEYGTTSDWWDEISSEEKESIERGLKDLEDGRVYPHDTVKKLYEKYL
jgi:hypothetical protein